VAFRVCFICTGNRCRSPFAETAFRHFTRGLPVEVFSAGTLEIEDGLVPPDLVEVARDLGF
jgi:protein-tyrosine-phosphatase